ncbi:MAG TPA: tetratricopeptide repeat protein, partial [Candidatus Goldiibacteriota bacterium]|nr:tetratricopeptide repeat protein [Candidatus Goldiibacteriota bacterium]
TLVPKGMLYAVLPEAAATVTDNLIAASKALWSIYSLRSLHPEYKRYGDDKSRDVYITDYSVSLNQAGTFMEDRSFFSLSLMYFKMAQRVKPLDHEYVYNIGNAYYNLGDYGSALDSYRKSLELRPSYENSWFNMGVTYYTLKKYDEAIQAFERVLKINPDRADVMANIRMIRAEMNGAR